MPAAPRLPRTLRVRRQAMEHPTSPEPTYYALTVPGMEELAADELRRAGADVRGVISRIDRRDGVVLFAAPDIRRALRCGTLEDVCQVLLDVPTPPAISAPKQLAALLDRVALEAALVAHNALRPKRHGRSYKVVCRVAGKHPFRREDLALAFERAVHAALPRWVAVEGKSAVEVWVHVAGPRTIVGLRLSGDELAQRTWKHAHLPASLKPSVARALILLAETRPGDVMLDLMCGAGTILRERADAGPARLILGGDSDREALAAARENVRRTAELARWDATRLPLRDACVDAVVTNPPYGRQHEAVPGIDRLYARSLREAARVLRPGGRAVVLTGEPDVLSRALPPTLRVRTKRRMLLRGLAVTAFVMLRT
jgi:tRNA (guanine6-N2)-methyltransferase